MYAVVVTFTVREGQMKDFLPLMLENARLSKELEVGCHSCDDRQQNGS